jgi:hypothetical protein
MRGRVPLKPGYASYTHCAHHAALWSMRPPEHVPFHPATESVKKQPAATPE